MRGEYIGKKSGKPRALITAEHDVETANALLFPCKGLMSLQVNKVTAGHISQWKTWINEKKYKKAGKEHSYSADKKNKALWILKETINPCFEGTGTNPFIGFEKWTVYHKQKGIEDILSPEEGKIFLEYCSQNLKDHNRAQGALNYFIYCRKSELLGLKAGDYDKEKATLTIQSAYGVFQRPLLRSKTAEMRS